MIRKIPTSLINGIKKVVKKREDQGRYRDVQRFFLRLKNADYRSKNFAKYDGVTEKEFFGQFVKLFEKNPGLAWEYLGQKEGKVRRVRKLDVSRNYPGLGEIIVKRIDYVTKKELIAHLTKLTRVKGDKFEVRLPLFEFINDDLFIMAKADYPNILELPKISIDKREVTARGTKFLENFLKNSKFTVDDITQATNYIFNFGGGVVDKDLLFLGEENGKLIFFKEKTNQIY